MTDTKSLLVINGPNLNLLGLREPGIYGADTLSTLENHCKKYGNTQNLGVDCVQSNHEGDLVEIIQKASGKYDGLIINAGAYTHTSIAILDALKAVNLPTIEVHISNIHQREEFRHKSYISQYAFGVICGLGTFGYQAAIDAFRVRFGEHK